MLVPAAGVAFHAFMLACQRALRSRPAPPPPASWPGVSILKPLKGVDPSLESNLHTFFDQDYEGPYEVLFGSADPRDPALDVARRVSTAHPNTPTGVHADARTTGFNPKVDTLANLARRARYPVILVSDSNVAVPRTHLREMVATLHRPGVGLVSAPVLGVPGGGIGAALESLQLNSYVMGGVAAMERVGLPCVVGKSMMIRASDLDGMGGFPFLGRFLAEDQVCGEETVRRGRTAAVAGTPVRNLLGSFGLAGFAARHLRWARIRSRMSPLGYAGEILLHPVLLAAVAAVVLRTPASLAAFGAVAVARVLLDLAAERVAGHRRPTLHYLALAPLRDLIGGILWPIAFLGNRVAWRGRSFRIGRRTEIVADGASGLGRPSSAAGDPGPPEVAVRGQRVSDTGVSVAA